MNQEQKAKDLLSKLNAQIKSAQERRDMAVAEADNMEARNRSAREGIDLEVAQLRADMMKEFKADQAKLNDDIAKLTSVKDGLGQQTAQLEFDRVNLAATLDMFTAKRDDLYAQVTERNTKLSELDEQIITATTETKKLREVEASIRAAIQDIDFARRQAESDLELLNKQVGESEARIIELDADFKAKKEFLDRQMHQAQRQLVDTQASVVEAARKDKAMREAWADEHLKLDKRTKTVQKMEARMSDAEARIQEYDNYMST